MDLTLSNASFHTASNLLKIRAIELATILYQSWNIKRKVVLKKWFLMVEKTDWPNPTQRALCDSVGPCVPQWATWRPYFTMGTIFVVVVVLVVVVVFHENVHGNIWYSFNVEQFLWQRPNTDYWMCPLRKFFPATIQKTNWSIFHKFT